MSSQNSRRRAATDALTISLGYLTSFVYPLVSLPFLARALGVTELGIVMILLAVLQVVVPCTEFGFSISALRRASLAPDAAARSRVLMETAWARTLIWAVCALPLLVVILAVPVLREHSGALLLGLLLVLAGAWYPGWLLQAMGRMLAFALFMALSRIVALVGLLLTVKGPEDVALAVGWQLAPQALAALAALVMVLRVWKVASFVAVSWPQVLAALRDSAPLFASNAAAVATGTASTLTLGAFATPAQVAFFGAAERFGNAARGVMRGVVDAMLPRMASRSAASLRRFISAGVLGAYVLAGTTLVLGAGWVIPWYLGAGMAEAVWPTRLVGVAIAVAGVTAVLTLHANAAHRYGVVARFTGTAAVLHVLLCVPAALWAGAVGVGAALIVSELPLAALFLTDALRRRAARRRGDVETAETDPHRTVPEEVAP